MTGCSDRESAYESTQKETKQGNIRTRRTSPSPKKSAQRPPWSPSVPGWTERKVPVDEILPVSEGGEGNLNNSHASRDAKKRKSPRKTNNQKTIEESTTSHPKSKTQRPQYRYKYPPPPPGQRKHTHSRIRGT
jgi:hypothetical protein